MKITDLIEETLSALLANKARSGLTVLGIVIGIGSVIAMISIGQGAQGSITSNIESLGSNLIMVMPGFPRGTGTQVRTQRGSAQTLTLADSKAIAENVTLAKMVAPNVSTRSQVTTKGSNTNTQIYGVTAAYAEVRNLAVENGVFISDEDDTGLAKVAVIGPTVSEDLFGEDADPVGETIRINKMDYKIIGVTVAKGGSGFSNQDDMIYIPLTTAQKFLTGGSYVSTISIQGYDSNLDGLQTEVTNLLMERHKITDSTQADFQIMNQSDIVESASTITNTMTILLGSVAGISLLVGGIGIMNMMLTTVTERTREIGLRKAIGAKRGDITIQFLTEAIMLTFTGGFIGVGLGWLASLAVYKFWSINTEVSVFSVVLAVGVSGLIGIVFGYYPAARAAKLNPINALRYE